MDIVYLFRVLAKRKWLILGVGIVAALLAFLLTANENKNYKSWARFSTGFAATDDIKMGDKEVSAFDAETHFNNVIVTYSSPSVISLLSYKLMLHDLENPDKAFTQLGSEQKSSPVVQDLNLNSAKAILKEKLETMTMLTSLRPEEKKILELLSLYEYDYENLLKYLQVYRVQRTDFIQTDYTSTDPQLSAFVVNNLFSEFLRYYRSVKSIKSQESIDTLRSLMKKKEEELAQKNTVLREKGIFIDPTEATTSTMGTIGEMELSLATERNRLTEFEYELKKIDQRLASLSSRSTDRAVSFDNEELVLARKAKNEAYKAYMDNPSDKGLENRYNRLNEEYQNKLRKYGSTVTTRPSDRPADSREELVNKRADIQVDILATRKNIASYQSKIRQLQGDVNVVASQSAAVESLIKDRDQANKEYLEAKQKYNDAIDFNTSAINNFRLINAGEPPIEPEPSKRKLVVGMAAVAAMITTMLILIFLVYLDSSIKTPGIFNKSVGLRMISMINFMNLKNRNLKDIIANKDHTLDAADKNRNNIFRESLRKLRYEIEQSGKKTILFTSTKKGQGKTTIIQALSYSLSLSRKKILIIDTNFCNNDLTVQLEAEPILEKIIPYKADSKAVLEQVKVFSKEVGEGSVFAIGSEGGDYTPSEIMPNENILNHLHALTAEFDYIFLEGPPLNDFSDSKELAQYVDGVIAVFSATDQIKQTDKQSIAFFKELNGKFVGSVLNKIDLSNVDVV